MPMHARGLEDMMTMAEIAVRGRAARGNQWRSMVEPFRTISKQATKQGAR